MAVRCTYCGRGYDVTLFAFGRSVRCACGEPVTLKHERLMDDALFARIREDRNVSEIRSMADRIASLIVGSDWPMIDIEMEKRKLRERIAELLPDKISLYDLIYEPRFRRLEDQFRS